MVKVELHGFEGTGKTLKEAKADAHNQADTALAGNYTPCILRFKGNTVLVWREPRHGWGYRLLSDADHVVGNGDLYASTGYADKAEVVRSAKKHLAQASYVPGSTLDEMDALAYVHKDDRRDLQSWIAFQIRYAAARATGKTDHEAHQSACYV